MDDVEWMIQLTWWVTIGMVFFMLLGEFDR